MTSDPKDARWRRFRGGMAAAPFGTDAPSGSVPNSNIAQASEAAVATARGEGGLVSFDGREVVIDRSGAASFIIHGLAGLTRLSVHDIEFVRVRRARGARARGYVQFGLVGQETPTRGGVEDANSVIFDSAQQPQFQRLAKLIQHAVRESQEPVVVETPEESAAPPKLLTVGGAKIADRRKADRRPPRPPPAEQAHVAEILEPADAPRSDRGVLMPERTTAEARAAFVAQWASGRRGGG